MLPEVIPGSRDMPIRIRDTENLLPGKFLYEKIEVFRQRSGRRRKNADMGNFIFFLLFLLTSSVFCSIL